MLLLEMPRRAPEEEREEEDNLAFFCPCVCASHVNMLLRKTCSVRICCILSFQLEKANL